jgi:hypothetical protein
LLERDAAVLAEHGPVLYQAVALQAKDPPLGKHHPFVEHRPVLEAEHHAALDLSGPADLEEIARGNAAAVGRAQHEETVGDALGEAHRDRTRHERAEPQ